MNKLLEYLWGIIDIWHLHVGSIHYYIRCAFEKLFTNVITNNDAKVVTTILGDEKDGPWEKKKMALMKIADNNLL